MDERYGGPLWTLVKIILLLNNACYSAIILFSPMSLGYVVIFSCYFIFIYIYIILCYFDVI